MKTMHFHIANTECFFEYNFVSHSGFPMNNLAPMRKCPGLQGRLNWMPG